MTARAGVVARWASRRSSNRAVLCECGEAVKAGWPCPGCRQIAGDATETVGMLAAVVDLPAGARLVVAEQTPDRGGWVPIRCLPPSGEAIRMLRRQAAQPTAAAADATRGGGGLW